jgi:hypothetical protein
MLGKNGNGNGKTYLKIRGERQRQPLCPLILDPEHTIADALGAKSTPQCFLIDPQNNVVFYGDPDDSSEVFTKKGQEKVERAYLADAIRLALKKKAISLAKSPSLGCQIDR